MQVLSLRCMHSLSDSRCHLLLLDRVINLVSYLGNNADCARFGSWYDFIETVLSVGKPRKPPSWSIGKSRCSASRFHCNLESIFRVVFITVGFRLTGKFTVRGRMWPVKVSSSISPLCYTFYSTFVAAAATADCKRHWITQRSSQDSPSVRTRSHRNSHRTVSPRVLYYFFCSALSRQCTES